MTFKKGDKPKNGFDKRPGHINKKGRPRTHDKLRALIQQLAWEAAESKPEWTRLELMIRAMLTSKSAADRENILRHGWGDVPKELIVSGKDIDAAIEAEFERRAAGLARMAGRSEVADAGTAQGAAAAGESGSVAASRLDAASGEQTAASGL